jgi:hypothetical protein
MWRFSRSWMALCALIMLMIAFGVRTAVTHALTADQASVRSGNVETYYVGGNKTKALKPPDSPH